MPLVRLIYVSQATDAENLDIAGLLKKARENNSAKGVTGMLWFNGVYFLQLLEGERENVNDIYHFITIDPRHTNFQLIAFEEIHERNFADWSMGYFSDLLENLSVIPEFNLPNEFKPDLINPESALAMLRFGLKACEEQEED